MHMFAVSTFDGVINGFVGIHLLSSLVCLQLFLLLLLECWILTTRLYLVFVWTAAAACLLYSGINSKMRLISGQKQDLIVRTQQQLGSVFLIYAKYLQLLDIWTVNMAHLLNCLIISFLTISYQCKICIKKIGLLKAFYEKSMAIGNIS